MNESPSDTPEPYERATSATVVRAVADSAAEVNRLVSGPYGEAHWSVLAVHVLWDAWLHERDMVVAGASDHGVDDGIEPN